MDYRRFENTYYIRMDRGDEIISRIVELCRKEGIRSAYYTGIGGCSSAEIQTFIPDKHEFITDRLEGMLELVSFTGNVASDKDRALKHHTHAAFAYIENGAHRVAAGHLKSTTVLYTAEIELRPVIGGEISLKPNPETGTGFWSFE